eukprot:8580544-Alexandrium_andersonii.AAC.1
MTTLASRSQLHGAGVESDRNQACRRGLVDSQGNGGLVDGGAAHRWPGRDGLNAEEPACCGRSRWQ